MDKKKLNKVTPMALPKVPSLPKAGEPQAPDQNAGKLEVKLDDLRKERIFIATPCYGGQLTEAYFRSTIRLLTFCNQHQIPVAFGTIANESLVTRARNVLVAYFLQSDFTRLMFIDADIGWEPWHLMVMLNRDVDVIGGLYPMKSLPVKWCVNGFDGAEEGPDGLQEVSKTGTGFMLIKRHVFEKLDAHPATKPFNNDIGLPAELNPYMKTYFDTAVRENRYYSEDWTFCENWRDLGGRVWVDKRVLLKHTGTYVFDFQAQDQLYKDLHAMAQANAGGVAAPVDAPAATPAPAVSKVLASSKKIEAKKKANNK